MTQVTATMQAWNDLASSIEWHPAADTIVGRIRSVTHNLPPTSKLTLVLNDAEFTLLEEPIIDMGWQSDFIIH